MPITLATKLRYFQFKYLHMIFILAVNKYMKLIGIVHSDLFNIYNMAGESFWECSELISLEAISDISASKFVD